MQLLYCNFHQQLLTKRFILWTNLFSRTITGISIYIYRWSVKDWFNILGETASENLDLRRKIGKENNVLLEELSFSNEWEKTEENETCKRVAASKTERMHGSQTRIQWLYERTVSNLDSQAPSIDARGALLYIIIPAHYLPLFLLPS